MAAVMLFGRRGGYAARYYYEVKFMLRQQVLKLYRSFLRAIRDVPDEESRKELLEWARSDFKNNKHHTDEYAIKMLISHGERQLKQLQQNVAFSR
ncbi:LYR motif-containing protein 2 isoform X3 [Cryptotermes secundus]|uniref:LYR motif-containing protein 2 isoform X3 n=1 Tax=Cryptotermes secundus TaxID=105785 RepID=UPI001454C4A2|nr:LYR motif-containing protein 2 isoform X3 [Cryptotermes secundus]